MIPFNAPNKFKLISLIKLQEVNYENLSPELTELLKKMLKYDPTKRMKW